MDARELERLNALVERAIATVDRSIFILCLVIAIAGGFIGGAIIGHY